MSLKTAYALSFQVPTDINAALVPDGTIVNSSFSTGSNTSGDPLIISGDLSLNSGFEWMLVFKTTTLKILRLVLVIKLKEFMNI